MKRVYVVVLSVSHGAQLTMAGIQMLEKLSKMCVREAMIELVGRPPAYGEQPRWLQVVADKVGITFRTARSIWNGEIEDENHLAVRRLRQVLQEETLRKARRDAQQVAGLYRQYAETLAATDPNSNRSEIDALLTAARILGGRNSA